MNQISTKVNLAHKRIEVGNLCNLCKQVEDNTNYMLWRIMLIICFVLVTYLGQFVVFVISG